ncbi:F-box/kelch-repeat protein At3g06240-like [Papaver somniferum]|uniref:F-box/kelch-repeat protein At3g06240-like n=1 Tax=Papaver somniferum TaxID=3469 RepID=UPI000E6F4E9E|nr:F-box/kelch-repeat protein At3g06240-like [Papaver somniferum]
MYPFQEKPCERGGDGITILSSCNGLICASHAGYIFDVWNPCTGEYRVIRSPFEFENRCLGFVYDFKACDYMFVSIYCQPRTDVSQVEINTLGSDSWENYYSYNPYQISGVKHGVVLNGAVHWFAKFRTSKEWKPPQLLISMDMEEIPQPEYMDDFGYKFVERSPLLAL